MANIDGQILSDRARAEAAAESSKAVEGLTKLPNTFLEKLGIDPDFVSYRTGSEPDLPASDSLEKVTGTADDSITISLNDFVTNYDWIKVDNLIYLYDIDLDTYLKTRITNVDSSNDTIDVIDSINSGNSYEVLEAKFGAFYDSDAGSFTKLMAHKDSDSWESIGKVADRNALTLSPVSDYYYFDNSIPYYNEVFRVKVPSDYATIQEAFDAVKSIEVSSGSNIFIEIEQGYDIPKPTQTYKDRLGKDPDELVTLLVEDGDYSHIVLTSQFNNVEVADDFDGSFIRNVNARGITTRALFLDFKGLGTGNYAYSVEGASQGIIGEDTELLNFPNNAIASIWNSSVYGWNPVIYGAGVGVYAYGGGKVDLKRVTAGNCDKAILSDYNSTVNIITTDSHFSSTENSHLNSAQTKTIQSRDGSSVNIVRAKTVGSQGIVAHAQNGSEVNIYDALDTNFTGDASYPLSDQSYPSLGTALQADNKSKIYASVFINYCEGAPVVLADEGSEIVLNNGGISNPVNNPVEARNGSYIRVVGTDIQFYDGEAYTITGGSIIHEHDAVGTANIDPNVPTPQGIFWNFDGGIPDYILSSEKGSSNGVAPLDSNGILTDTYLENYGTVYYKTFDPSVADDSDLEYEKGDVWINTNTDGAYIAVNVTVGAAVWVSLAGGASSPTLNIATPTANDIYVTLSASTDFEISGIVHYMNAGSLDFDVKVNGTSQYSVTGVGQTITTSNPSSPIAVAEGDNVSIQCSNISADAALLSLTLVLG